MSDLPAETTYHRWLGWHAPDLRRAGIVLTIGVVIAFRGISEIVVAFEVKGAQGRRPAAPVPTQRSSNDQQGPRNRLPNRCNASGLCRENLSTSLDWRGVHASDPARRRPLERSTGRR